MNLMICLLDGGVTRRKRSRSFLAHKSAVDLGLSESTFSLLSNALLSGGDVSGWRY